MSQWNDKCLLHMDLDAFFASVEQLDHPEYQGKPVIVGGKPGNRRSVVSTASYEARKFGVHSAMPTTRAVQLCPHGIFVHPRMKRYQEKSAEVMAILCDFSPDIRQISVDEAFIDLSGTERLFGDPSDTAHHIKAEIKERTGLTVSVGLATNRYIAKIASGFLKPDGFCEVLPGTEETFMLALPLEKVWGIGTKTQERLHAAGFRTTKDIHNCSKELLTRLIGNAAGIFLYNAVRGQEVETFKESLSHSISSETTFPFDLIDRYTIGTALMELAHTVMFRLLRENLCSKTVTIKIRYEDFSTITVQETSERDITSLDDLFARASELFDKKYERGRGLRLLGLGVQNTDTGSAQQELFDFDESKKKKVEKAILSLEKKDPSVRIQKARILDTTKHPAIILLFFASFLLFHSFPARAENMNETKATGAGAIVFDKSVLPPTGSPPSSSLFQYELYDQNIEFLASGYWKSSVKSTAEASFGFGNPFALSLGTPVFTQQVDLSLWFMVNRTWYFEASFADGFEKNTVAAGYYGDGILKEARIANRGIAFPSTYSIDTVNRGIGGGNNQAPGVSAHFEDETGKKWRGDFAFRYDMLESHNKTYYGKNSVSDNDIAPSAWLTGQLYVLPSTESTSAVTGVYVESSDGSYKDLQGRTYKKLSESEYLVLPARCEVILSTDAGAAKKKGIVPAVALEFNSQADLSVLANALGTYGTAAQPGSASSFLGKIQRYFGSSAADDSTVTVPNVASYSYGATSSAENTYNEGTHCKPDPTGMRTDGFFTYIGGTSGTKVLLVQHPAGFSPFAGAWRYDGGTAAVNDVVVASSATGTASSVYAATVSDDVTFVSNNFFSDSHTYIDVYAADTETKSQSAAVKPEVRYPFANSFPGYYLGSSVSSDLIVRLRSYTAVTRFDIGTDAVQGTVRVYKNGVIDSAAKYNAESGTVTLSSSVSNTDRVYITWYEESASKDSGALTAAAGFIYNLTPSLSADIALSTRWSYNPEKKYADSNSSTPGFATLASGIKYNSENLTLADTAAATLESDNVTGYYRILGMNDAVPETVYLTETAGVSLPENFVPVLNNRPDDTVFPMPELSDLYNGSVDAEDGTTDSDISGYKIPVSWDFGSYRGITVSSTASPWAATAIDLKSAGSNLASGTQFSIALKTDDTSVTDYDVYLQLGVNADDDFTVEDTESIPTWKISDSAATDVEKAFTVSTGGWQTVTVILKDEDRARFTANYDARIIIVMKDGTLVVSANDSGTVYVGPFEITTQGIFTAQADDMTVKTEQCSDTKLQGVNRFNTSTNHVQKVSWKNNGTIASQTTDDFDITMYRYFSEIDITPYTEINMYFRYTYSQTPIDIPGTENDAALTFILDRDASGIGENGKIAAEAVINQAAFKAYSGETPEWHLLTINRIDNTVSVDGTTLSSNNYTLRTDADIVPVRLKMIVNTAINGKVYSEGEFCLDELYLSGSTPHYILENRASASWKKNGVLVSAGSFPLVSDISFSGTGSTAVTVQTGDSQANGHTVAGNIKGALTVATLALSGDIAHTSDSDVKLSNAGHCISTTTPLAGILSANEEYRFDRTDTSLKKNNTAAIQLKKIGIPLTVNGITDVTANSWSMTQNAASSAVFSLGTGNAGYSVKATSSVYQKLLPSSSNVTRIPTHSYQQGWKDSTALAFSSGKSNASRRTVAGNLSNQFHLPFAGLAPEIGFQTNGIYKASTSVLFTDSAVIKTEIPFIVGKNRISLKWEKGSGSVRGTTAGGDYSQDIYNMSSAVSSRDWFFKSLPIFDLASNRLADTVLADTSMTPDSAESLYYTTTYSASWKRPVLGTLRDIWIPTSATLAVARDIRTSATISDVYQIKTTTGYTAFNIFGSAGKLHWTTWFLQDEYACSLSAIVKIPRKTPDEVTMLYAGYLQANFYITDTDSFRTGTEFSLETDNDWSTKFTFVWKRRGNMSPLLGAIILFKPDFDTKEIILTRTDSLNCAFSEATTSSSTNSSVVKKQSIEFSHLLDMQMTKYLTVTGSISENWNCTWNTSILIAVSAGISVKITF